MKRYIAILALIWIVVAPATVWGQANLPFSPNASPVQGPDPTGQLGYPLAVVGAPGGAALNITGSVTGGPFAIGTLSTVNSFSGTLAPNASFTGAYEIIQNQVVTSVSITSNETFTGTAGTFRFDWSQDGINAIFTDAFSYGASFGGFARSYDFPVRAGCKYLRVRFTTTSGSLPNPVTVTIQTIYRNTAVVNFPHFLGTGGIWTPFNANQAISLLPVIARTTQQGPTIGFINPNFKGAEFTLKVTAVPAIPGAGGLDLQILAEDATGSFTVLNLSLSSKITTTGTFRWIIYPGTGATGSSMNVKQILPQPFPAIWGYTVTVGDAQSYTYGLEVDELQ